jgi:DNA-binding SARP family transcriptional activator
MGDGGLFVGLLGPLVVRRDGSSVRIGSGKQRLVLGALAVAGRPVSPDELIDVLWAEEVPATAVGTLHTHVSRLRALIGGDAVVDVGGAYRLDLGGGELDSAAFAALVGSGREARDRGDHLGARHHLRAALSLWRGPALASYRYEPFAQLEVARLEELRLEAIEDRCELDIVAGDTSVAAELQALTAEHPFRERLTLLLMRALYRAGRQADALAAARRLRRALRDDLGLDPGPEVDALERRILEHDPALSAVLHDPLPRRAWHVIAERIDVPAPEPQRQCDQLIEQAVALRRAGRLTDARSTAAAAVRLASRLDDHHRLGAAALALAGPPEDSVRGEPLDTALLEGVLAELASDDRLRPMLQARLAVPYADDGNPARSEALLTAAEASAAGRADTAAELYVLRARHRTWFDPTALVGRLALSRRMERLAAVSGQVDDGAWADRWLANDLLEAGDLDGSDRLVQALADANDRLHDPFHHWGVAVRRAGRRAASGPLAEAESLATEALNLAFSLGSEYTIAVTSGLLFALRWRQQRLHELDALVQDLADREPAFSTLIPLLHLELGRHEDGRKALRELARRGVRQTLAADPVGATHLTSLTALSHSSLHLDDRDTAAQVLEALEPVQSTMAVFHPGVTVLAPIAELRAAALACLGNLDDSIAHAETAADLCARTGCAAVGVRTNALLATLLRRRARNDDDDRATQTDHEIERLVEATGAPPPLWYSAPAG